MICRHRFRGALFFTHMPVDSTRAVRVLLPPAKPGTEPAQTIATVDPLKNWWSRTPTAGTHACHNLQPQRTVCDSPTTAGQVLSRQNEGYSYNHRCGERALRMPHTTPGGRSGHLPEPRVMPCLIPNETRDTSKQNELIFYYYIILSLQQIHRLCPRHEHALIGSQYPAVAL